MTSLCLFRRVRKSAESDRQLRHVCPSVRMEQLGSHRTGFSRNLIFRVFFENLSRKFNFRRTMTSVTYHGLSTKTYIHLWQDLAEFFLEWETFQTKHQNTHFVFNNVHEIRRQAAGNMFIFPSKLLFLNQAPHNSSSRDPGGPQPCVRNVPSAQPHTTQQFC